MLNMDQVLELLGVRGTKPTEDEVQLGLYKQALSNLRSLVMEARRLPGTDSVAEIADERIRKAEKLAGDKEYGPATLALAGSEELLREAIVSGRELQQRSIEEEEEKSKALRKALQDQQPYAVALSQARVAQQELRALPGAEQQAGELTKLIDDAEKLAVQSKYADARKLLEKGTTGFIALLSDGIDDLVKSGKESSGKRVVEVRKQFAQAFEQQRVALGHIEEYRLHPRLRAGFEQELKQAVLPLFVTPPGKTAQQDVIGRLDEIDQRSHAAIVEANFLFGRADLLVADSAKAIKRLSPKATPGDRADLDERMLRLKALMEQRDYQAVIHQGAGSVDDCDALNEQIEAAEGAWLMNKHGLGSMASACQGWIDKPLAMLAQAQPGPATLLARIGRLQQADVGSQTAYAQANLLLGSIEGEYAMLLERVKANAELDKAIEAGELRVQSALNAANEAKVALLERSDHAVRGSTGNPLGSVGEHGPKIDAAALRWGLNKAAAVAEADLQVDAIEAGLREVARALKAVDGLDAYMGLLEVEKTLAARGDYAIKRQACVDLLEKLQPWGLADLAGLQQTLTTLDRRAAEAHDETEVERHCLVLAELEKDLRIADSEAGGRHKTLTDQGRLLVDSIDKALLVFAGKLADYGRSFLTESPEYEAYHKLLSNDFNGLKGQLAERDVDVVAAVVADLQALKRRVDEGQRALVGRNLPPGSPTLAEVDKRMKRAKESLAFVPLTEYMPDTQAALKLKLDAIDGSKSKRPIDASLDALARWQQEMNQALMKASSATTDRAKLDGEVEAARKTLDSNTKQFADQPKYLESLKARLTKCLAEAKGEGQVAAARVTLQAIDKAIEAALKDPEAMKGGQAQAVASDESKKQDEATWKGLYEVFTAQTLPAARKAADAGLYKEIAELGKIAQQTFSKTADLDIARQQLKLASDRAQDAIAYPGGKALHFRKALGPAEERWQKAVLGFQGQLDELCSAVETAEALHAAAMKQSAQALKNLLMAGAFQACVGRMNSPGASAAALREAREEGLATLRRYRQAVQAQRQMVVLSDCELVSFVSLLELNNALFDIERNLLISA